MSNSRDAPIETTHALRSDDSNVTVVLAGMQWCGNAVELRSGNYFGAGTALRQISLATGGTLTLKRSGSHVVLVRLTVDQFIFWPKLSPNAGFGIKNLKKIPGVIPSDPFSGRGRPPPAPMSCAGTQAPPLLGPRSRKPFPQITIYHYTPVS